MSSKRETYHHDVRAFYEQFSGQVWTTDYVLDETITLLYARYPHQARSAIQVILSAVERGRVTLERVTADRFDVAWQLRQRYGDKSAISFTDLTSMVVMQEQGVVQILTQDEHFTHVGMGFVRVPALA